MGQSNNSKARDAWTDRLIRLLDGEVAESAWVAPPKHSYSPDRRPCRILTSIRKCVVQRGDQLRQEAFLFWKEFITSERPRVFEGYL